MSLEEWEGRYRAGLGMSGGTDQPVPLLVQYASGLAPGQALDLACGTGRNAVWLADRGWQVTAVDGSETAIAVLRQRKTAVKAVLADLEKHQFTIEPESWDLIVCSHYFQRDLVPQIEAGVRKGGLVILVVHINEANQPSNYRRADKNEFEAFFSGWEVLERRYWPSGEPGKSRLLGGLAARRRN